MYSTPDAQLRGHGERLRQQETAPHRAGVGTGVRCSATHARGQRVARALFWEIVPVCLSRTHIHVPENESRVLKVPPKPGLFIVLSYLYFYFLSNVVA